jgi:hypothetical protein
VAQVSKDEGDTPDAAWVTVSVAFPLHYSKGFTLSTTLAYFSLSSLLLFL